MVFRNDAKLGKKRGVIRLTTILFVLLVVALLGGVVAIRFWYRDNLRPLLSEQTSEKVIFDIESGETIKTISKNLKDKNLIRNAMVFEWYIRSEELRDELQAGRYELAATMSIQEIAKKFTSGDVSKNYITILPGKRIDQIEQTLRKAGFSESEVATALNPTTYTGHPALVFKPEGASLEGYLYPETFQIVSTTKAKDIIRKSLDEMAKRLDAGLVQQFQAQNLTPHQAIILASIVLQESSDKQVQPTVAQVFLKRLKMGMNLGSDVTYIYAAAVTGQEATPELDSPYNTRKYSGLPPGPISNVTSSSLEAVANPSSTNYLFFVAGDDGTVHFSNTQAEHESLIEKYCTTACGR